MKEISMLGNVGMGDKMVQESSFYLMERSILGVGRMERNLVKEDSITLMEQSMSVKISMG